MNAPTEPYSITPARQRTGDGKIEIEHLSFRYAENLPFLYEDLSLTVEPGSVVAIMGPSGSGKSTLGEDKGEDKGTLLFIYLLTHFPSMVNFTHATFSKT